MVVVHTTAIDSPIGGMRLAATQAGLAYIELPHASGRGLDGWLRCRVPDATVKQGFVPNQVAAKQIVEYLEGKRLDFDLELDLLGTPFQRKVWQALLEIPYGETRSYREIATRIGRPNAVRAVGTANGSNPLSLVVPCHASSIAGADSAAMAADSRSSAVYWPWSRANTPAKAACCSRATAGTFSYRLGTSPFWLLSDCGERLFQVGDQVRRVLDAARIADQ